MPSRPHRHLALVGDIFVKLDDFTDHPAEINAFAPKLHHAGLGLGDVQQRVEHVQHALGFLDAIGQRLVRGGGRGLGLERGSARPDFCFGKKLPGDGRPLFLWFGL